MFVSSEHLTMHAKAVRVCPEAAYDLHNQRQSRDKVRQEMWTCCGHRTDRLHCVQAYKSMQRNNVRRKMTSVVFLCVAYVG